MFSLKRLLKQSPSKLFSPNIPHNVNIQLLLETFVKSREVTGGHSGIVIVQSTTVWSETLMVVHL